MEFVDRARNDEGRLAVLAALVLLALNAGELLEKPKIHTGYETVVLSVLARQLEKQPEQQREDTVPEPEREPKHPKEQGSASENTEDGAQELSDSLLERIRVRRYALNPHVPMPEIEKPMVRAAKVGPEAEQEREIELQLPEELQQRLRQRRYAMAGTYDVPEQVWGELCQTVMELKSDRLKKEWEHGHEKGNI